MLIRFTPEADAELTEAREWYSHQRAGLDAEFMHCIDEALLRVVRNPQSFPVVYRDLRRVVVRRFPFAIFYDLTSEQIHVTAVFHSRRNSELWQSRVIRATENE
ncbi:MAG TPA: type II toxin-antitoxin system RelE/ParE family toxin [Pyrinomonadaceae bacterium]|jgi:plasmid stabilization system protein ParE|nr:type II toxin-antitoxin system RelE/ParE family toxin [Pyrinomonadaceae bacterium]